MDGDPGEGKSTLVASLAAHCSGGCRLPGSKEFFEVEHTTLVMECEDSKSNTWVPRLKAAGAALHKVIFLEGTLDEKKHKWFPELPGDIRRLEYLIRKHRGHLVVIDPLYSFLDSKYDAYKDQHMKLVLRELADLADRTGACILGIRHLNKAVGLSALYRGTGSVGVVGTARAGLMIVRDKEDEAVRYLGVVKSNQGIIPTPLKFHIESQGSRSKVVWDGEAKDSIRNIMSSEKAPVNHKAVQLLMNLLGEADVPANTIFTSAERVGISEKSIKRAKKELNIRSYQTEGVWLWSIKNGK